MTASPLVLREQPFGLYDLRVSATLTSLLGPVEGVTIAFLANDSRVNLPLSPGPPNFICDAITNTQGIATCVHSQVDEVAVGDGYSAGFGGNDDYGASGAAGQVIAP